PASIAHGSRTIGGFTVGIRGEPHDRRRIAPRMAGLPRETASAEKATAPRRRVRERLEEAPDAVTVTVPVIITTAVPHPRGAALRGPRRRNLRHGSGPPAGPMEHAPPSSRVVRAYTR